MLSARLRLAHCNRNILNGIKYTDPRLYALGNP